MGTKTIRLDEEAYERLSSRKHEGESFSEVVKRVIGERSLLEIAGILSDEEADELRATIEDRRNAREEELDELAERLK